MARLCNLRSYGTAWLSRYSTIRCGIIVISFQPGPGTFLCLIRVAFAEPDRGASSGARRSSHDLHDSPGVLQTSHDRSSAPSAGRGAKCGPGALDGVDRIPPATSELERSGYATST